MILITIAGIAGLLAMLCAYKSFDLEWGLKARDAKNARHWFALHEVLRKDVERLTRELEEAKRTASGPND